MTCSAASNTATSAVAGAPPAGTSSMIRPSFTTTPRSAPSARMARGSLIQIGFESLISRFSSHPLATGLQGRGQPDRVIAATCSCDLFLRLVLATCSCDLALVLQDLPRSKTSDGSAGLTMDLNTITAIAHPQTRSQLPAWTP